VPGDRAHVHHFVNASTDLHRFSETETSQRRIRTRLNPRIGEQSPVELVQKCGCNAIFLMVYIAVKQYVPSAQ
jgi:hypothetical protein